AEGSLAVHHSVVANSLAGSDGFSASLNAESLELSHSFVQYGLTGDGYFETGLSSPDSSGNYIGGPLGGPIDPMLGPLQYNGGSTPTHRPLPGSPLIDAGNP